MKPYQYESLPIEAAHPVEAALEIHNGLKLWAVVRTCTYVRCVSGMDENDAIDQALTANDAAGVDNDAEAVDYQAYPQDTP